MKPFGPRDSTSLEPYFDDGGNGATAAGGGIIVFVAYL